MTNTMTRENQAGTDTYLGFMQRGVKAYSKAAAAGDVDTTHLEHLAEVQAAVEQAQADVAMALRAQGYSWQQIGDALGITRAAAYRRYVGAEGTDAPTARKVGGQPGHLR